MKWLTLMAGSGAIPPHIVSALKEQPARSGQYNWFQLFAGDIGTFGSFKDKLHEYDIVQINLSPVDMVIVPEVRRILGENSKTKLVLNNDYVCEYWGKWELDPYLYDNVQRMGDMVFSTEKHQVSNMIDGTFVIPHPTRTEQLKCMGIDSETKVNSSVGFIFHWWVGETYLPNRTLKKLEQKGYFKHIKMFSYNKQWDTMKRYKGHMFADYNTIPNMPFPDYAEEVMKTEIIFDPNPYHTYGRNGVEAACWKIPVIGSNRVFSYNKLFPELTIDPFDYHDIEKKFDIVLEDKERLKKILDKAYDDVEYFNYENSKKRFMDAYNTAISKGGHKWYKTQI